MEEWKEFSAKTADEALTNALIQMETTSDQINRRRKEWYFRFI